MFTFDGYVLLLYFVDYTSYSMNLKRIQLSNLTDTVENWEICVAFVVLYLLLFLGNCRDDNHAVVHFAFVPEFSSIVGLSNSNTI